MGLEGFEVLGPVLERHLLAKPRRVKAPPRPLLCIVVSNFAFGSVLEQRPAEPGLGDAERPQNLFLHVRFVAFPGSGLEDSPQNQIS